MKQQIQIRQHPEAVNFNQWYKRRFKKERPLYLPSAEKHRLLAIFSKQQSVNN